AGYKLYRVDHAVGTQNYICLPSTSEPGVAWSAIGPQATLFDRHGRQVATHFLSANPDEPEILRPTWQHSGDTSAVWAKPVATSTDPSFVAPDAVPWLLLEVVGRREGLRGRARLTWTSYIQRVN